MLFLRKQKCYTKEKLKFISQDTKIQIKSKK